LRYTIATYLACGNLVRRSTVHCRMTDAPHI
jgi:hypothetical protein